MISAHGLEDDTSEILLVTLRVARVLKKHIWGSCFDLCIDDLAEEFAGGV
jgi:hypothetical protein